MLQRCTQAFLFSTTILQFNSKILYHLGMFLSCVSSLGKYSFSELASTIVALLLFKLLFYFLPHFLVILIGTGMLISIVNKA